MISGELKPMRVSVIATVYNEGASLHTLLDSLAAQSRPPDEVVIADGGSTDNTLAILEDAAGRGALPLKVLSAPGSNISQGRNLAIAVAAGPVIAATDAGVRLDPGWLEHLVAPIESGSAAAAGFFQADPLTLFEIAMGATVLPAASEIDPTTFLPSSRSVAFLKEAWTAAGGYPEWLDYCEDLVFDFALRDRYGPFPFVPQALAHFRPRGTLPALFRQYYRYARGDGKADLWRRRHAVRYGAYLLGLPLLAWLGARVSHWFWALLALGGLAYCGRPLIRLQPALRGRSAADKLQAVALVPLIRLVGDIAKIVGYPAGVWWRLTSGEAADWRRRRPDPR
jgi:glycosyltransferase involved in cell wall biosynthesis